LPLFAGLKQGSVPESDQQYKEAENQPDKAVTALLRRIRETFITLYFPNRNGIVREGFKPEFKENKFNGEEQIIGALIEAMKFEDFQSEDAFIEALRKKCEQRIFTQQEMTWAQIMERAATETTWQWYHPKQMDELKKKCLMSDTWREVGGYIKKCPFAKDPTDVIIEQTEYDD